MIFVKLVSGLGNQLFQYSLGRQLSIEKNVELKLDISFFYDQNLRSFKLNHFNINATVATQSEIDKHLKFYNSNSAFSRIYRRLEKLSPRVERKVFKEKVPWNYEQDIFNVSPNIYLDGYWQNYRYFQKIDPVIFKELILKESYSFDLKKISIQIINDQNSVSIHVRRGDYLTDKEANHLMGVMPISYYYSAIDYIKQKINKPNFYIFSDDLTWVKKNFKINDPCFFINGEKDYIDLDLMSKCKHNIIANSSFSWWGAFLNTNPDKIIIAPKHWVQQDAINNRVEIVFPSWVKL